jgi:hypothetical protein
MKAGGGGVENELADRNAHAAGAEVAEAENAAAVGDDNDVDVGTTPRVEHVRNLTTVVLGDEETAVLAQLQRELLTRLADHGRVDERCELFKVIRHQSKEQRFVATAQRLQIQVAQQRRLLRAQLCQSAARLLLERFDTIRNQSTKTKMFTFITP